MLLTFDDRPSLSPYIERVWRSRSAGSGNFLSMAEGNIELVVTRLPGFTAVTIKGPVLRASEIDCPPYGDWLAIRFRLGTHFPRLPTQALLGRDFVNLPVLAEDRFWLCGLVWEIPRFEDAEELVGRMARAGVIVRDHAIDAALGIDETIMSQRSVQRHFARATGLTLGRVHQIDRARHAAAMLTQGRSILDTTYDAGYFDQAHLTRSLRQLIGITPARLIRDRPQLSFSYKTEPH
jgi:AraC-like DNA-binding protein